MSENKVDQIIAARWIVPVVPKEIVFDNYALVISNGIIIDLLPQNKVFEVYTSDNIIQLDDHVLTPGFVNTHTHLAMSLFRGLADDLPLKKWLDDYIWPAEQATLSEKMVLDGTTHALAECIRSGVTCINDHYFYPNSVIDALEKAQVRGRVSNCIFNFLLPWVENTTDYFTQTEKTITRLDGHTHIYPAIGPHAPYTVDDEVMEKVSKLAKKHDLPIHIHLHESSQEINDFKLQNGMSPVEFYASKGWLDNKFIAVHMTQLSDNEAKIIADKNISIVHCPESNMKLSSGALSWQKIKQYGINLSLGTDGAASNNDLDMLGEAKTAALLAKLQFGAESLAAFEALEMLTINGAKALYLEDKIGSLEIGKEADFIAINLNQPETLPVYHPVSQIIYAASRGQITDVWCQGKRLMEKRKLLTIETDQLKENQVYWSNIVRSKC